MIPFSDLLDSVTEFYFNDEKGQRFIYENLKLSLNRHMALAQLNEGEEAESGQLENIWEKVAKLQTAVRFVMPA